jgi:hypothetical protein
MTLKFHCHKCYNNLVGRICSAEKNKQYLEPVKVDDTADIIMDVNSLNLIQEQAANWTFCGL